MSHSIRWRSFVFALAVAAATVAQGQFTSRHSVVRLAGNFNGYDTLGSGMRLVSNGVWMAYASMTNFANPQFLFTTNNFSEADSNTVYLTWKETNQTVFTVPMSGIAETNGGGDIGISGTVAGILRFQLDENTGAYSVKPATFGTPPTNVWINEIHYDNSGTDANEGFEIAGASGTSLTNYQLVLYNGEGGAVYNTLQLSGSLTNASGGLGFKWFGYAVNGVQNGSPDGVALVRTSPGTSVVQFLSYEGSFTASGGPASGMLSTDIGVTEESSTAAEYSLQLSGTGAKYSDFIWVNPVLNSRGQVNSNQVAMAGPPPASVIISNFAALPAPMVMTNQPMTFRAQISAVSGASNISPVLFYRVGPSGNFLPMAMTNLGNTYTSASNVPPQPNGTLVYYYLFVNFDGAGTNSPTLNPASAPSSINRAVFSTQPFGQLWINELNTGIDIFATGNEFIELAGQAGLNLAGWTMQMLDTNLEQYASYTVPAGKALMNDTNGFGFYVYADPFMIPAGDAGFTNYPSAEGWINDAGALRLYNQFGILEQALSYGANAYYDGFTHIGEDPDLNDVGWDRSLVATGTGSNALNFTWTTSAVSSAGTVNEGQTLVGGNTNPIPPYIQCPNDILLPCPTNAIPTNNPATVVATGYCGNGSVIVTWAGDVTNSGTGCKGNPKIVTRSYKVVSTNCSPPSTNTCSHFIILEDTNAPVLIVPTQTLANAGFENGSLVGWSTYGLVTNEQVNAYDPRSEYFHLTLKQAYSRLCRDVTGNGFDGSYSNGTTRGQTGASTNHGYSCYFDGATGFIDAPPLGSMANTATFITWLKRDGTQPNNAGIIFHRGTNNIDVCGFQFTTTNQLGYTWNNQAITYGWSSGIVPPTGQWAFVALTISPSNAIVRMCLSNVWSMATNVLSGTNHQNAAFGATGRLNFGRDPTAGRQFKGHLDDVQIYRTALSFNDISNVYNRGLGGVTVDNIAGRWPLDELFLGGSQSGIYQDLAAGPGQTWAGAVWAKMSAPSPLVGTNLVNARVQFLNSTNAVLSNAVSAISISSASSTSTYVRLLARGIAPANTAKVRFNITYQQDGQGDEGAVNIDDAFLTDTFIPAGAGINQCGKLPDFTTSTVVSVSDNCGTSITKTQSPAPNSNLTNASILITITATDGCGNQSQGSFTAYVDDQTPPSVISVKPAVTSLTCRSDSPATTFSVFENCPGWFVTLLSTSTNEGTGCPGSPIIISNIYRVTDIGGNTKDAVPQVITIVDSNAPGITISPPALNNAGFESGAFTTNWSTYGNATAINISPRTGSWLAKLAGVTNGADNYNGFYQDLPTQPGETWRLGAWVNTPTNETISGANRLEAKIEFYGAGGPPLATNYALVVTNNAISSGIWRQLSASGTAPDGTILARATFNFVQSANATGAVLIDDTSLSRTTYSATSGCAAILGDITNLSYTAVETCSDLFISSLMPNGTNLVLGTNRIALLLASDTCGNTATGIVPIVVVDDQIPVFTLTPPDLLLATTNQVPPPSATNVAAYDLCSTIAVTNLPDTNNGGQGVATNVLVIVRTYRALDTWGNAAITRQTITVNGTGDSNPPPPTNVVVTAIAPVIGTNLTVRSTGTNTWSVLPEYVTNLLGAQFWQAASNISTVWSNGTNVTTFSIPTNAKPAFIRIKQTQP